MQSKPSLGFHSNQTLRVLISTPLSEGKNSTVHYLQRPSTENLHVAGSRRTFGHRWNTQIMNLFPSLSWTIIFWAKRRHLNDINEPFVHCRVAVTPHAGGKGDAGLQEQKDESQLFASGYVELVCISDLVESVTMCGSGCIKLTHVLLMLLYQSMGNWAHVHELHFCSHINGRRPRNVWLHADACALIHHSLDLSIAAFPSTVERILCKIEETKKMQIKSFNINWFGATKLDFANNGFVKSWWHKLCHAWEQ